MDNLKVGWMVLGERQEEPYVSSWGLIKSEEDLQREYEKVKEEIKRLQDYNFNLIGGDIVKKAEEVQDLSQKYKKADVLVVYGVSGAGRDIDKALATYELPVIFFVKVKEDEMYGHALYQQWYAQDFLSSFEDVDLVINDYEQLIEKLKAHRAVKRLVETKVLCVGNPNDFFGGETTARKAAQKFDLTVNYISFEGFKKELEKVSLEDKELKEISHEFLNNAENVKENIDEEKVLRSARMYKVLTKLMKGGNYNEITVNCLSGILNLIDTTPCLDFQKMRDRGITATCEADIPQTITTVLLKNIANKPTFINDPVIAPDENKVIMAHCTSATKMAGYDKEPERYDALLHHETKLGVAPSVKMREGQEVTIAGLSHDLEKMIVTRGKIVRNTNYHICITQVEVKVKNAQYLLDNFVGFHWVLVYGDYLKELEKTCNLLDLELLSPDKLS